jgi:hypothetical protein
METTTKPTAIDSPTAMINFATLKDMLDHSRDSMEFLAQAEAILNLVIESLDKGDAESETKRLAIQCSLGKIVDTYNTLDTCLCFPLHRALTEE